MPIVFVHGVATREPDFTSSWVDLERYLRHYVAPVVSPDDPGAVKIVPAIWGNLASRLRFGGISRPKSAWLGMGADNEVGVLPLDVIDLLPDTVPQATGSLLAAGPTETVESLPIRTLSAEQLSDFGVACAYRTGAAPAVEWLVAADDAAHDPTVRDAMRQAPDDHAALGVYQESVARRLDATGDSAFIEMGAGNGRPGWLQRLTEAADRVTRAPGFLASRVLGEARKPVNELAVRFIGDVFVYLKNREHPGNVIGEIPRAVLDTLIDARKNSPAGEPMVVVSHSMGGQIVYDLITYFIPTSCPNAPRIDFWCATASQIGLFLELDLFAAKDNGVQPLAYPANSRLGCWWNVWDYNDFLSFSVDGIVSGVDDEEYSSGLSLIGAHSGYLRRPSLYRKLRAKLERAKARGWTP